MIPTLVRSVVAAGLLALGACTPDSGPPDIGRGSADSPATMLVDQLNNGVPTASGTQAMVGASAQSLNPAYQGTRSDFGGALRPIEASGGQRR